LPPVPVLSQDFPFSKQNSSPEQGL